MTKKMTIVVIGSLRVKKGIGVQESIQEVKNCLPYKIWNKIYKVYLVHLTNLIFLADSKQNQINIPF